MDRKQYYKEYYKNNKIKKDFASITRLHLKRCGHKRTDITLESWKDLREKYGWKCASCRRKCSDYWPLCMDHIIPPKLGGKHMINNIQPLCTQCNSIKGVRIKKYGLGLSTGSHLTLFG